MNLIIVAFLLFLVHLGLSTPAEHLDIAIRTYKERMERIIDSGPMDTWQFAEKENQIHQSFLDGYEGRFREQLEDELDKLKEKFSKENDKKLKTKRLEEDRKWKELIIGSRKRYETEEQARQERQRQRIFLVGPFSYSYSFRRRW